MTESRPLIAWNAMQVRAAKSGVGQYIHALTEAILETDRETPFLLYGSPDNIGNYDFSAPNLRRRTWGLPENQKWRRLAYEYAFLPADLKREAVALLHGLSNFLPLRKVCPYVVTVHDLSYYVSPERCPPLRRRYWYAATSRTMQLADKIITISENSRKDIEHFFPDTKGRIIVVPEASHSRFRKLSHTRDASPVERLQAATPYILYVGTLEPGKNVERIIDAFESVAAEFPQHKLVLIGDKGWLFESIFRRIETSKVRDRICVLGHRPDHEVVEYLNFCDVFVFPSLYEGFGLPPLEAMACGAPVVTSNTSSIPEVVGDAALQVDPTSVADIAAAIRTVLSSESERERLSAAGIQRASRFSWAKTAAATLEVYRSLLST